MSPCPLKIVRQWVRLVITQQCHTPVYKCYGLSRPKKDTQVSEMTLYSERNRKYKLYSELPIPTSDLEKSLQCVHGACKR